MHSRRCQYQNIRLCAVTKPLFPVCSEAGDTNERFFDHLTTSCQMHRLYSVILSLGNPGFSKLQGGGEMPGFLLLSVLMCAYVKLLNRILFHLLRRRALGRQLLPRQYAPITRKIPH
jgi:hypothetical protein